MRPNGVCYRARHGPMSNDIDPAFLLTCIHEAGHAVVADVVGASFTQVSVDRPLPGQPKKCELGCFHFTAEPPLYDGVLVGLAGYVAEDTSVSLAYLRKYYRFNPRTDVCVVEREVRSHFVTQQSPLPGSPQAQLVEAYVTSYVRQPLGRLRSFLAMDAPKRAVVAVAEALRHASDGVVTREDVSRLCAAAGVARRPNSLMNGTPPQWATRSLASIGNTKFRSKTDQ